MKHLVGFVMIWCLLWAGPTKLQGNFDIVDSQKIHATDSVAVTFILPSTSTGDLSVHYKVLNLDANTAVKFTYCTSNDTSRYGWTNRTLIDSLVAPDTTHKSLTPTFPFTYMRISIVGFGADGDSVRVWMTGHAQVWSK